MLTNVLWRSFDHGTPLVLALGWEGKLGVDERTTEGTTLNALSEGIQIESDIRPPS